jgi:hypothetical protein
MARHLFSWDKTQTDLPEGQEDRAEENPEDAANVTQKAKCQVNQATRLCICTQTSEYKASTKQCKTMFFLTLLPNKISTASRTFHIAL